jgi:hypothetical protein
VSVIKVTGFNHRIISDFYGSRRNRRIISDTEASKIIAGHLEGLHCNDNYKPGNVNLSLTTRHNKGNNVQKCLLEVVLSFPIFLRDNNNQEVQKVKSLLKNAGGVIVFCHKPVPVYNDPHVLSLVIKDEEVKFQGVHANGHGIFKNSTLFAHMIPATS